LAGQGVDVAVKDVHAVAVDEGEPAFSSCVFFSRSIRWGRGTMCGRAEGKGFSARMNGYGSMR
jgi:hypothetical protein